VRTALIAHAVQKLRHTSRTCAQTKSYASGFAHNPGRFSQ
jgi:hypothetical protein